MGCKASHALQTLKSKHVGNGISAALGEDRFILMEVVPAVAVADIGHMISEQPSCLYYGVRRLNRSFNLFDPTKFFLRQRPVGVGKLAMVSDQTSYRFPERG